MENSSNKRDWQVLLIGGASGVGKTSLSYRLAHHFGVGITEVDDFQVILEKLTTPQQQPLLHYWRIHPQEFSRPGEAAQTAHFVRVCQEVFAPALEAVIANHLTSDTPVVLEGDFVLPTLAVQPLFEGVEAAGRVRAIFVHEEDETQIARNFGLREGRKQAGRARASWLFGQWLRTECDRLGVTTLPARPWETGFERAIATLAT